MQLFRYYSYNCALSAVVVMVRTRVNIHLTSRTHISFQIFAKQNKARTFLSFELDITRFELLVALFG